jgi:hypothetical protein
MRLVLIGVVILAQAGLPADSRMLDTIFVLAGRHDTKALEKLSSSEAIARNSLYTDATNLALYVADPVRYERRFAETFPQDADRVMRGLYEQIELKKRTPEFLYSFKNLGRIARGGSVTAARKLFGIITVSDGVVGEQVCDDATILLRDRPALSVGVLSSFPADSRANIYASCFGLLDRDERTALKARLAEVKPRTPDETKVIREIRKALMLIEKR